MTAPTCSVCGETITQYIHSVPTRNRTTTIYCHTCCPLCPKGKK